MKNCSQTPSRLFLVSGEDDGGDLVDNRSFLSYRWGLWLRLTTSHHLGLWLRLTNSHGGGFSWGLWLRLTNKYRSVKLWQSQPLPLTLVITSLCWPIKSANTNGAWVPCHFCVFLGQWLERRTLEERVKTIVIGGGLGVYKLVTNGNNDCDVLIILLSCTKISRFYRSV